MRERSNFSKDKDSLIIIVYKKSFIIVRSPSWSKPHMVPTMLKNTFSLQWIRVCHPSAILRCSSEKQLMGVTCFVDVILTPDLDLQPSILQSLAQILTRPNSALELTPDPRQSPRTTEIFTLTDVRNIIVANKLIRKSIKRTHS